MSPRPASTHPVRATPLPAAQRPQVAARIAAFALQAATARGADATRLMALVGLDPAALADPDARLPLAREHRLWDGAAELTGDPHFGLHAAELIRPGAFDVLDYAVRTAPDLRAALERLARYNRLLHDSASFHLSPVTGGLRIEHRLDLPEGSASRQVVEFTLASLVVVAAQLGAQPVAAQAVTFRHGAPGPLEDYRRVFGVTPQFNAPASALVLGDEVLRRPVPAADPGLSRIVIEHAERLLQALAPQADGTAARLGLLLAETLTDGPLSLGEAARRLGLSERSLQRRLEAEGTTFAALLDGVRKELALRYVADLRLALGEVAYLLGFAEPSPFHRAFRRWTGTTPAAARRTAR